MSELNAIPANLSNNFTIDTVVVAAGVGKRFGSQMPKQYTHIGSQTVLQHSIAALSKVHQLSTCYLVVCMLLWLRGGGVVDRWCDDIGTVHTASGRHLHKGFALFD